MCERSLEVVVAVGPGPERRLLIDDGAAEEAAEAAGRPRGGGRVGGGAVAELHLGRSGGGRGRVAAMQELVDGGGGVEREAPVAVHGGGALVGAGRRHRCHREQAALRGGAGVHHRGAQHLAGDQAEHRGEGAGDPQGRSMTTAYCTRAT